MNPVLVASLAAAGLVAARGQRAVIARYATPGAPPPGPPPPAGAPPPPGPAPPGPAPPVRLGRLPRRAGPPPLTVEVTSALLLGALAARVHPGWVLAAACWLALCAVPLALIDAAVRRLPDPLTGAAYVGTTVLLVFAAATSGHWHALAVAVLGGVALSGCYLLLVLISPAGMGMGDVKAAASIGTLLAWPGWRPLLAGGMAGFLLASVCALALLALGLATRKQHIPFGPFMLAGAFAVTLATL
jgi:leader peptidase (prepilin peptidase) / N-methyltransferase